jgi:hypothetical protein
VDLPRTLARYIARFTGGQPALAALSVVVSR